LSAGEYFIGPFGIFGGRRMIGHAWWSCLACFSRLLLAPGFSRWVVDWSEKHQRALARLLEMGFSHWSDGKKAEAGLKICFAP
jgi:hypothetical protein